VQKKQAFETLPLKNGTELAVQEGWGATPFGKKGSLVADSQKLFMGTFSFFLCLSPFHFYIKLFTDLLKNILPKNGKI
jgi:hypothetical protein